MNTDWIDQTTKLAIYLRDGVACVYCGKGGEEPETVLTLDHVRPRSRGGSDEAENLVTCCHTCKQARGARELQAFCRTAGEFYQIDPEAVERHVRNCRQRQLPLARAKAMTARRSKVRRPEVVG